MSATTPATAIEAVLYEVKIYEGMTDFAHDGGKKIKEAFIPSLGIIFNEACGTLEEKAPRNTEQKRLNGPLVTHPTTSVMVSGDLAENIKRVVRLIKELDSEKKLLEPKLKEFFSAPPGL